MKPKIFISSSAKGMEFVNALTEKLSKAADPIVWSANELSLSGNIIEKLNEYIEESNYGVFFIAPDELSENNDGHINIVKENILFELGLWLGKKGKDSMVIVAPDNIKNNIFPSDIKILKNKYYSVNKNDLNKKGAVESTFDIINKEILDNVIFYPSSNYDANINEIKTTYFKENIGIRRLKSFWEADKFHIIISSIAFAVGLAVGFDSLSNFIDAIMQYFSRVMHLGSMWQVNYAFAAESPSQYGASGVAVSHSSIINELFTISLLIAFFWSFAVSLHSDNPKKVQTAKEYSKLFGGILIGSARSVLGV